MKTQTRHHWGLSPLQEPPPNGHAPELLLNFSEYVVIVLLPHYDNVDWLNLEQDVTEEK